MGNSGIVLLSKDLDGIAPFLDPLEPIPDDHVQNASRRLEMSVEAVRDHLSGLAPELGWDPLLGARDGEVPAS